MPNPEIKKRKRQFNNNNKQTNFPNAIIIRERESLGIFPWMIFTTWKTDKNLPIGILQN